MDNFGESHERRVILFSNENTLYQLQNDKTNRRFLTNNEIKVVSTNNISSFLNQFRILGGGLPQNNMMLVLSPFDDITYVEVSEAKNQIALYKLFNIIQLCGLLGAKSVEILNIKIHEKESNESISTNLQYGVVKGSLNSKMNDLNNLKNQIKLTTNFNGSEPNYEEGKKFLQEKRLNGDVFLSNLLEMRNHNVVSSNPIKHITKEVCMTDNLQKTFDLVSKINFPVGYFETSYQSVTKEKTEIFLTIKIDF